MQNIYMYKWNVTEEWVCLLPGWLMKYADFATIVAFSAAFGTIVKQITVLFSEKRTCDVISALKST